LPQRLVARALDNIAQVLDILDIHGVSGI